MRTAIATALVVAAAIGAVALGACGGGAETTSGGSPPPTTAPEPATLVAKRDDGDRRPPPKLPSAAGLRAAREYADRRTGVISFAVVNSEGKLRGDRENRRFSAASAVKAMLLAAETRRLKHEGERIDSATDALLTAMITASDNDAADAIYARSGDAGLYAVARRARMTRFAVAGHWGNAQIAAADMARLFADLDRVFPRRFRVYAKGLLGSVIESQSWGIPVAAGERWAVRFKGGWLPERALVHQAAELRERDGERALAIAVLTDGGPSHADGVATVEGVAARLLSRR
jgi:hypothetical protein